MDNDLLVFCNHTAKKIEKKFKIKAINHYVVFLSTKV